MFFSWSRVLANAKNINRNAQRAAMNRRAATVRERFIPRVEPLEPRLAPSVNGIVTNLTDTGVSNDGSLRGEIVYLNASGGGTITFTPGLTGVINLTKGNLQLTTGITIDGAGANITVSGKSLTGITNGGVFSISTTASDAINLLTITGGTASGRGGGVYLSQGNLTLSNDTIEGNAASALGGGVYSRATLIVVGCFFTSNTGGTGGAITADFGTFSMDRSTITGNSANQVGGIYSQDENAQITNSTISDNSAVDTGGVRLTAAFRNSSLTIINTTFSGNTASGGTDAALRLQADSGFSVTSQLTNVTIANNTLAGGSGTGGVWLQPSGGTFDVRLDNTIVAANTSGGAEADLLGNFDTASSNNLIGVGGNLVNGSNGNIVIGVASPGLGFLQNNGGPTQTMALLPSSPALSHGNLTVAPSTDQRGFQRVVNNRIDIGAFQNQRQWFTVSTPTQGGTYYATRSASFNLGSFTYSGSAPSVWAVDVSWGDGTHSDFTTLSQGSLGSLSHAYSAAGSFQITVTVSDAYGNFNAATTSKAFTVNAAPVATYINPVPSPFKESAQVGSPFATAMVAQVLDQYLNPMPGVTVLFAAPTSGASGAFANGTTSAPTSILATTDASGDATATAFTANHTAGSYYVYASTSGVGPAAPFLLTNTPGPVTQFGVYLSVPGQMNAGQKISVLIEAQDSYGNLVTSGTSTGDSVTLTSTDPKQPLGGAAYTHGLVNGQWTFTSVQQDTPGVQTLTATDNVTTSIKGKRDVNVVAVPPTPTTETYVSGNNQSGVVGTALAAPLVVKITDSSGNPVTGVTVGWVVTGGGGRVSAETSVTNASGQASVYATLGTAAGSDTFQALVPGLTGSPVSFTATAKPGAPASITATAGSGQSALVNTAFGTNLAVVVKDQYGNLVPGVTVVFAAPGIGFSGTFAGSASVTTNAGGVATAPTFTANLLAGTYTVIASVGGVGTQAGFTLTNLSPLGTSASANFVENAYGLLLNRVADSGAMEWVNQLAAGVAPSIVVQEIEASGEYLTDVVRALYQHYLNRPGSPAEWQGWVSMLAGGSTIEQVAAGIVASPEFFSRPNEGGGTGTGFIQALYGYILGRAGSSAEVAVWVNGYNLASAAVREQVALAFLTSQEYHTDLLVGGSWTSYVPVTNWGGYYPEFLRRPADALGVNAWLQQFQAGLTDQAILAAIFASNEGYAKWS